MSLASWMVGIVCVSASLAAVGFLARGRATTLNGVAARCVGAGVTSIAVGLAATIVGVLRGFAAVHSEMVAPRTARSADDHALRGQPMMTHRTVSR